MLVNLYLSEIERFICVHVLVLNCHSNMFPIQICDASQISFPVLHAAFTNFTNIKNDAKGNVLWEMKFPLFKPFLICCFSGFL